MILQYTLILQQFQRHQKLNTAVCYQFLLLAKFTLCLLADINRYLWNLLLFSHFLIKDRRLLIILKNSLLKFRYNDLPLLFDLIGHNRLIFHNLLRRLFFITVLDGFYNRIINRLHRYCLRRFKIQFQYLIRQIVLLQSVNIALKIRYLRLIII